MAKKLVAKIVEKRNELRSSAAKTKLDIDAVKSFKTNTKKRYLGEMI